MEAELLFVTGSIIAYQNPFVKVFLKKVLMFLKKHGWSGFRVIAINDKTKDRVFDTVFCFMVHLQGLEPGTH